MPKFQFKIVTGANEDACKTKYDRLAIETSEGSGVYVHDPYTFYLFDQGGVGYLGDTPLFGGDASKFNMLSSNKTLSELKPGSFYFVTSNITITDASNPSDPIEAKAGTIWITDNNTPLGISELSWSSFTTYMARYIAASAVKASNIPDSTYIGNETSIMTSAAVKKLIDENINAQKILGITFFKDVRLVTLTQQDIDSDSANSNANPYVTFIIGEDEETHDPITATAPINYAVDHVGDIGLVFQVQVGPEYDESKNDGDKWIFINLHGLIDIYIGGTSYTTTTTVSNDPNGASHTKQILVEVNKSQETRANFVQNIRTAINSISEGNTYNPAAVGGNNYSNNKFITESQLAEILAYLLTDFVQYNSDEIIVSVPDPMEEEE